MSSNRDAFYDDGEIGTEEQRPQVQSPPRPAARKSLSSDGKSTEILDDPTVTPRSPSPRPSAQLLTLQPETIEEEIYESRSPSRQLSSSDSFESDRSEEKDKDKIDIPHRSTADINIPNDRMARPDELIKPETTNIEPIQSKTTVSEPTPLKTTNTEPIQSKITHIEPTQLKTTSIEPSQLKTTSIEPIQSKITHIEPSQLKTTSIEPIQSKITHIEPVHTETNNTGSLSKTTSRKSAFKSETKRLTTPLVKTLFDQTITSALPIISFCRPFSMTSHVSDIILAMPRHLMIINNQNSVSVYPWQQSQDSTSTILECFWCSFLYKLLVTTLEDNRLFIYDFISITDSIKLRGHPLSIKHQSYHSKQPNSQLVLPTSSSRTQPSPATWSQTRFTKSNLIGIYYCYINDRHNSCMLTRIDHNTRQHINAIDCSGGSIKNNARVCAMGLSEERVGIVLTNLIMTLYDAETLVGLKQINLSRWIVIYVVLVHSFIFGKHGLYLIQSKIKLLELENKKDNLLRCYLNNHSMFVQWIMEH
jgi:hypothetical protein